MKLSLFSHFYNEELLLPGFIDHYKNRIGVDNAILVNYASTDNSVEIIKELAPEWEIVDSRNEWFNAGACDAEMMDIEASVSGGWKLTANITEWLWCSDIREYLSGIDEAYSEMDIAIGMRSFILVDNKEGEFNNEEPLWKTRHFGFLDVQPQVRRWRYMHNASHGNYHLGRHGTHLPHANIHDLYMLYLGYSPWPQCIERKMQIQTRIPESDKAARLGWEHIVDEDLVRQRWEELPKENLLDNSDFQKHYLGFLFND